VLASEAAALETLAAALLEAARCEGVEAAAQEALEAHAHETAGAVQELHAAVGELDEQMKRGAKRAKGSAGVAHSSAAPAAKKRKGRARRTQTADDALAAAGLEDDDADAQEAAPRRTPAQGLHT